MNTVQKYPAIALQATPTEQPAPSLQQQVDTLQNIALTLANPHFRQYYGYSATMGEIQLQAALSRVLDRIDPLVLEALAAHDLPLQA
ncbi:hypothetical protein ACAW74_26080 [Fibrella sp. WM1]|uniref:hypothetical protein n=1 Tax=Fibrella musci TaxID=3242485 RepID=UPI0035215735